MIKVKISHRELMRHVKFWLFVLPVVLGFLCFSAYPLIRSLTLSFTDAPLIPDPDYPAQFIGFENFVRIFTIDMTLNFGPALLYTLIYAVIHVPVIMAISLGLALILNKKLPCSGFFRVVFYLPALLPAVGMSIMFRWLFTPSSDGFINSCLNNILGINSNTNYLMDGSNMWLKMWLWGTWKGLGWSAIIYISSISGIDPVLYEAATVDGAGRFQQMWHVTIPQLMPTFFVMLLMSIANVLSNGMEQYLVFSNPINSQSIEVLDLYVYNLGIVGGQIPMSTMVGMCKSIISVILLFAANTASKKLRGQSII